MRKVARKSLITVVAASGALAVSGGYAHADSGTSGASAHSPGVLSGNTVQVPVHVPVNVCGNTVNVVGLLNPAAGNSCGNGSGGEAHGSGPSAGAKGGTHDSPGVGSGNTVQVSVDAPVNACGNSVNVVAALNSATGAECGDDAPSGPGQPQPPGGPDSPGGPGSPGGPESPGPSQPPGDGTTPPSHEPGDSGGPGSTPPGGDEGSDLHPQTPPRSHEEIVTTPAADAPPAADEQLAQTGTGPVGVLLPTGAALLGAGVLVYRKARAAGGARG